MPYKDPEKQRAAVRKAVQKLRRQRKQAQEYAKTRVHQFLKETHELESPKDPDYLPFKDPSDVWDLALIEWLEPTFLKFFHSAFRDRDPFVWSYFVRLIRTLYTQHGGFYFQHSSMAYNLALAMAKLVNFMQVRAGKDMSQDKKADVEFVVDQYFALCNWLHTLEEYVDFPTAENKHAEEKRFKEAVFWFSTYVLEPSERPPKRVTPPHGFEYLVTIIAKDGKEREKLKKQQLKETEKK